MLRSDSERPWFESEVDPLCSYCTVTKENVKHFSNTDLLNETIR